MSTRAIRRVAFATVLATVLGAGQWWMLRASVPQVASGSWAAAGDLGAVPEDAAGAALADGRLVVAGGRYPDGSLVSQIGIYDPATGSWEDGGHLATARFGHSATALQDGRVVIAGGITAAGVTFDIEIYDPATGQSVHAGDMLVPRVNHGAAELKDGTVLIVGGSDGSLVLNLAERFTPETGESRSLAATLGTPREKLTATTLLDGHVLVAGGQNGGGVLASAELYDPSSFSFFETGSMHAPRSGHVAVLLPSNNQVLIAGGGPSTSAELYADWRNGFTVAPSPMSVPRAGAIGGGLLPYDLAIVSGGGSTMAEYFGYATVKTDKDDYWPGETVTVTGSGWQPGETVTIKISEDADTHNDFIFQAVADAGGNIVNTEFAPIEDEVFHHFGMRFYVTATGAAWTALNTFTDGDGILTGEVTDSVTGLPLDGASVSCGAGAGGCSPAASTMTDASGDYELEFRFPGSNPRSVTFAVTKSGYVSQSRTITFSDEQMITANFSLVPIATSTSTVLTTSGTPSTYGGSVTFTATVTPASATGSIQFRNGGIALGAPVPVTSGQAVHTTGTLPAGTHSITAEFTGTPPFSSSTSNQLLQQVDAKPLTITASDKTKQYGTALTPVDSEFTTSALVTGDTVTSVTLTSDGYAATAGVDGSPYAITPSAAVGTGLSNYSITYVAGSLTVNARALTVTADPQTKAYGDADAELTYEVTSGSLVNGDRLSGSLARDAGEDVGTYAITLGTLSAGANYDLTFVGADFGITPASLGVSAHPQTKEYGASDPPLTYSVGGLKFTDTAASVLTGGLVRAPGETVAGGPYVITQGTLAANDNYTINFSGSSLSITPAQLTVTANPQTKVYGDADPALTYEATGFKFDDTPASVLTGALARAAGETVVGSPYAITQGTLAVNSNYTLSFVGSSLEITARPIEVTADPQSKVYGETDPALTYQITSGSLAFDDEFTGALVRASGENVGSYPITQGALALDSNYALSFIGANLVIEAKPASVTPNAASKEYGSADPALTGTLAGFLAVDAVTATYSRTSGEMVLGGPYTISATLSAAGLLTNYTITYNTAPFTITPKPASVTPNAATKIFGATDPPLTGTLAGFLAADGVTATYSRTPGETVTGGPYTISATLSPTAVLSNYDITYNTALFTITAWNANGFHQPVGIGNSTFVAAGSGVLAPSSPSSIGAAWNAAKGGSTIPLKFNVFAGSVEVTSTAGMVFTLRPISCSSGWTEDDVDTEGMVTTGNTSLRYDGLPGGGGQFIQNWKTPSVRNDQCYRVELTLPDASVLYTFVKLRK